MCREILPLDAQISLSARKEVYCERQLDILLRAGRVRGLLAP